jgi:ABC-type transport system substrate-binding protein
MAVMIDGEYGGSVPLYNSAYAAHFDLHLGPSLHSTRGGRAAFNGLVHYNFEDAREVLCDLCADWALSDDGLTYTFNMNPAATWQNGDQVTAGDVKYSLDRMVEAGEVRPRAGAIRAYYESSRVVDDGTLEVTTSFPAAAFLKFLALDYMVIVSEAHTTSGVDVDLPENVMGSGAFRLVDAVNGESWAFEKNENYWKPGLPFLDRADVLVIQGRSNQLASLLTGQTLSAIGAPSSVDSSTRPSAIEQSGGKLRPSEALTGPIAAFVNHLNPPFDDVNVRKAVNLAINRQEFKDGVYQGVMWPGSYFGPGVANGEAEISQWEGYRVNDDGSKVQEDLDSARALLESSGYGPDNPLQFDIMVRTVSIYPTAAVFLKEQFEAIAPWVEVDIEEVESVAGITRQASGEFQMSYRIIATLTDDPDGVFLPIYLPGGSENPLGYEDPRVVDIFERQKKELDPATRLELLREADDILRQGESQWFQVGWGPSFGVASVKLKNVGLWPNQYGEYLRPIDMLAELEHVWLDPDAPLYDPNNPPYPAP